MLTPIGSCGSFESIRKGIKFYPKRVVPDLIVRSCHNRSRFRDNRALDSERLEAHLIFLGHDLLLDEGCMRVETLLDLNTLNRITCLLLMKVALANAVSTRR